MLKTALNILWILPLILSSCQKKNEGEKSITKSEKVKTEIDILSDSTQAAWDYMMNSDNQKLKDVKRLLDEVSYTGSYNTRLYDSLQNMHQQVQRRRYTSSTMGNSANIDAYDLATDSLLKGTMRLVNTTPDIESHPLARTLIDDIMSADNNLVLYRARYDRWVKEYNNYLDKNEKKVKKLGPPYDTLGKKPMFTLYN